MQIIVEIPKIYFIITDFVKHVFMNDKEFIVKYLESRNPFYDLLNLLLANLITLLKMLISS